jgi:hypothetical protein
LRPIKVWPFYDAPKKYALLTRHGGDEDWVALIPKEMTGDWIGWAEEGTPFGCCDVQIEKLDNGDEVRIGAHA